MLQKLLINLDRTSAAGEPMRNFWLVMGAFFAIAICIDFVQLSRGRSDPPEMALLASMLSMTAFFLSRRRSVRLLLYACWIALLLTYFILRAARWSM
jgi:hypothetical protein